MIFAVGLVSCYIYCFAIGILWQCSSTFDRWLTLASTVAKALWISWLVSVAAFYLHIDNPLPLCIPPIIILLGLNKFHKISNEMDWHDIPQRSRITFLDLPFISLLACISYSAITRIPTPLGLFTKWDAVVSWNRWAIELVNYTYEPASAGYPILFPGIWSLIYKAQGTTEIWFLAKLSLYFVPFLCICLLASLAEQGLITASVIATIGFILMLVSFGQDVVSGYMDAPVSLMMLACGLWMILFISGSLSTNSLSPLSALVGVTAITKQAGILMIIPYFVVLFFQSRSNRLCLRYLIWQLVLILTPILIFLVIYLSRESSIVGNLELLASIASNSAGSSTPVLHAFDILFGGLRWLALIPLLGLSLLNFFNSKDSVFWLGAVFLLLFVCFFPVFAVCCSYDVRNGWWLISLLLLSGVCGVAKVNSIKLQRVFDFFRDKTILSEKILNILTPLLLTLVIVAASFVPNKSLKALQHDMQWNVGYPTISALLRKHRNLFSSDTKLITTYMPARWLPGLEDSYVWCQNRRSDVSKCVYDELRDSQSYILMRVSDYAFLNQSLKKGYLLDESDGFQLYGPYEYPTLPVDVN